MWLNFEGQKTKEIKLLLQNKQLVQLYLHFLIDHGNFCEHWVALLNDFTKYVKTYHVSLNCILELER